MSQTKTNYNNKENMSQLSQHKIDNHKKDYDTFSKNKNPVLTFLNELYNHKKDELAKRFCIVTKKFESDVTNITSNINRFKTSSLRSPFTFQYKNNKDNHIIEFNNKSKAKQYIIKEYTKILNNLLDEINSICNFIQNKKFNDLRDQIKNSFNILDEKDVDLNNQLFSSFEKKVKDINKESQKLVVIHNKTDEKKLLNDYKHNCHLDNYALTGLFCILTCGGWIAYRKYYNLGVVYDMHSV